MTHKASRPNPIHRLTSPKAATPYVSPRELGVVLGIALAVAQPVQAVEAVVASGETRTSGLSLTGTGDSGVIEQGAAISTSSGYEHALSSMGTASTLTNRGTLSSSGNYANAINSAGASAVIVNSGTLSTSGRFGSGIDSYGVGAKITNSGTISSTGGSGFGIFSSGANAEIANSGTINTFDSGIRSSGTAATITNNGTISTSGTFGNGIEARSSFAAITNNGNIRTTGDFGWGIASSNQMVAITNDGSIVTAGALGHGIYSASASARIANRGTISTTGSAAYGIQSLGASASIANSGTISTTADSGRGIYSSGSSAVIVNSGTVRVSGATAYGIQIEGSDVSLTNSGLISAAASGSYAIFSGSFRNQTLNLLSGSRILGAIDLGDGTDTATISGSYGSAAITMANTEIIHLRTSNAVQVGTDLVIVIDPTSESSRSLGLSAVSSGLHNVISQRMQATPVAAPIRLAARDMTPGMVSFEQAPIAWAEVFGSRANRTSDGQMLGFDHRYAGVMGGYEKHLAGDRIGWVVGAVNADTRSPAAAIKTEGAFAGIYRHTLRYGVSLTGSLMAGVERHANRRTVIDNLNGEETAQGRNGSFYLSPSLSAGTSYALTPDWQLRPSGTLSYSVGRYTGYSESGTTQANLALESRTVQTLTGRVQLEVSRRIGRGEISLRTGMQTRRTTEESVRGSVGGSDFRFGVSGDTAVAGHFAAISLRQVLRDQLSLVSDIETGRLGANETHRSARLSLLYQF